MKFFLRGILGIALILLLIGCTQSLPSYSGSNSWAAQSEGPLNLTPKTNSIYTQTGFSFTPLGGVPPYFFSIQSGPCSIDSQSGLLSAGTSTGTCQVQLFDSTNASVLATVTVTQNPNPNPNPSPSPTVSYANQPLYVGYKTMTITENSKQEQGLDLLYATSTSSITTASYTLIGTEMNIYTSGSSTRFEIYMCQSNAGGVTSYFPSTEASCYGSTLIGSIGFLEQDATAQATVPIYSCTGYPSITGVTNNWNYAALIGGEITPNTSECETGSGVTTTLIGYAP